MICDDDDRELLIGNGSRKKEQRYLGRHFQNVFKSFVGANFLTIPHGFYIAGIPFGICGITIVSFVTGWCCHLLVQARRELMNKGHCPTETYCDVAEAVLGRFGYISVECAIAFTQFGYCVGYLIFVSNALHNVTGIDSWIITLVLFVPCYLNSLIKDLKVLAIGSSISNICLLACFIMFWIFFINQAPSSLDIKTSIDWPRVPIYIGIQVASLEGIASILPVEGSMENDRYLFPFFLYSVMIIVAVLFSCFASTAVMTLGSSICSVLVDNLIKDSVLMYMISILVSIGLLLTYPLQLYPLTQIIDSSYPNGRLSRMIVVGLTCFVAIAIPTFELFISFVGSIGASYLSIVLPCLLAYKMNLTQHKQPLVLLIIVGVAVMILGGSITLMDMIKSLIHSNTSSCESKNN